MRTKRLLRFILFGSAILLYFGCIRNPEPKVRMPALAGQWYPGKMGELAYAVDSYIASVPEIPPMRDVKILILPHAGYPYSGQVAAYGYALAKMLRPDLIVIFGTPHRAHVRGVALSSCDFFETPLGKVKVDKEGSLALSKNVGFSINDEAHRLEHSIEIHLPFLQRIYGKKMEKEISLLPLLIGEMGNDIEKYARIIASAICKRNPFIIASSDFAHYGPRFEYLPFVGKSNSEIQEKLKKLDMGAIHPILKFDREGFERYVTSTGITVCGRNPIALALALPIGLSDAKLLKYDTSCAITGECDHSVSYAAIAIAGIWKEMHVGVELTESDRNFLLRLSRKSIRSFLVNKKRIVLNAAEVPSSCRIRKGVFVTLKKFGQLRGCIGSVIPRAELYEMVIEHAYHAACCDPRFLPLTMDEFDQIEIEISILSEPVEVHSIDEIVIGRDGLIIEKDGHMGLLLPQVAVEQGWSKEEFLLWLCRKANLPDNAWRMGARIYRFQALVFGERS
ncbi:MAG: AmmeMemoRadiSam system protein B [Spirochaetes bacterium]|nr:AmmeMemoRadiSam system protein B [Spirochaetota bacterium]